MIRNLMFIAGLMLWAVTCLGCRSRPIQTVMRGSMDMNGAMRVDGNMQMSGDVTTVMRTDNTASRLVSVPVYAPAGHAGNRRIAVLDVDGLLLNQNISGLGSLGENPVALFREKLDALVQDGSIAAIVLRINSPGGGVTASDIMTRDILELKQQLGIPVVACVMDVGAGGGYYLATAADRIVAHPTAIVGGIGVILNVYVLDDLGTFNVRSVPVKAGDKIDMGTPQRQIEPEERVLLQSIADQFHQRFLDRVSESRPELTAQSLERLSDGRVVTGTEAVQAGLVDSLGYLDDAVAQARELAGLPPSTPVLMLRRDNDRAYTLLDVTPNTPTMSSLIPLKIPGLDRSRMPTFMYLWQPEPSMVTQF